MSGAAKTSSRWSEDGAREERFVARGLVATEAFGLVMLSAVFGIVAAAAADKTIGGYAPLAALLVTLALIGWLLWRAFRISGTLKTEGVEIRNLFREWRLAWHEIERVQPAVITIGRVPVETIGIRSRRSGRLLPILAVAGSKGAQRSSSKHSGFIPSSRTPSSSSGASDQVGPQVRVQLVISSHLPCAAGVSLITERSPATRLRAVRGVRVPCAYRLASKGHHSK